MRELETVSMDAFWKQEKAYGNCFRGSGGTAAIVSDIRT